MQEQMHQMFDFATQIQDSMHWQMSSIGSHVNVMESKIAPMELTNQIAVEALERHQPLHDELQLLGMRSPWLKVEQIFLKSTFKTDYHYAAYHHYQTHYYNQTYHNYTTYDYNNNNNYKGSTNDCQTYWMLLKV